MRLSSKWAVIVIWLLLNLLDATFTLLILKRAGVEYNLFIPSAPLRMVLTKTGIALLVLVWLWYRNKVDLLKPLNIGLGVVVAWIAIGYYVQVLA